MALLDVYQLTMRFGGLTAVDRVDLHVDPRQIFSVIGPNGAGKTTVFNAITGIYDPTEGKIAFEGRSLRRPFTWRVVALCAAVGILTALAAVAFSVDLNDLWRSTIKRNYDFASQRFDAASAWRDLWRLLGGALAVEPQTRGRWAVTDTDGDSLLGFAAMKQAREEAEQLRDEVRQLIDSGRPIRPVQRGQRWALLSADGNRVLVDYGSQSLANRSAETLGAIRGEQRRRKITVATAFVLGLALSCAGTLVVWNRARRTPDVIALAGIARTFQNIRLFANMTVLENVLVGLDRRQSRNVLRMMLRTPGLRREEVAIQQRAFEALKFVGLDKHANVLASSLAYGDQRRLEIARAMATDPKLILLDEPAAGMNPAESGELMKLIRAIRERGVTVLLIEHHMNVVMGISDSVAVLDYGQKIAEGTPDVVRSDPRVIEAYLGKETA